MDPMIFELSDIGAYMDDSISMIRLKIYNKLPTNTSVDEMYLCLECRELININILYVMLTAKHTVPITQTSLRSYCANIKDEIIIPSHITEFTLSDLYTIFDSSHMYTVFKPLGQQLTITTTIRLTEFTTLPARLTADVLTSSTIPYYVFTCAEHSNDLFIYPLVDLESAMDAKIHVYLISRILTDYIVPKMDEFVTIYYPRLHNRIKSMGKKYLGPITKKKIMDVLGVLSYNTSKLYDQNKAYFNHIRAFYSIPIGNTRQKDGITKLIMTYNNAEPEQFPMDYIFKSMHASELMPCVRFTALNRGDSLLRLFLVNDLPILPKSTIVKMATYVGKTPGISAIISMSKYAYINNINLDTISDVFIVVHVFSNGNLKLFYDTTYKNILPSNVMTQLLTAVMGFFSEVINDAMTSYNHKLPINYRPISKREATVVDLEYTLIYPETLMKPIVKTMPYLPAVFSGLAGEGTYPKVPSKNETNNPIEMLYARSSNLPTNSPGTIITISEDPMSSYTIFTVTGVPSFMELPLINDHINRYVTVITTKDLFSNYKSSCVPHYNIYYRGRISDDIEDTQVNTPRGSSSNNIPISAMYSALTMDNEGESESNLDTILHTIEEMVLVRKSSVEPNGDGDTVMGVPLLSEGTSETSNSLDADSEDILLGDMGW